MVTLIMCSNQVLYLLEPSVWKKTICSKTVIFTETNSIIEKSFNDLHSPYIRLETFDSYFDNNQVFLKAIELHKQEGISKIISLSEGDLLRSAALRDYLKIPGESYQDILPFRDKWTMKAVAQQNNIPMPVFAKISNPVDLLAFIQKAGYPIITKPFNGMGSFNTVKISNELDAEQFIAQEKFDKPFLAEQFLTASICHIDGLILNGELVVCSPAIYLNNCLEFLHGSFLGSYTMAESNPLHYRLLAFTKQILQAFPKLKNSIIHLEVFIDEQGGIHFCEIACRLGGNGINFEVQIAHDINMMEVLLDFEYKGGANALPAKTGFLGGRVLIPPVNGVLMELPSDIPFDFVIHSVIKHELIGAKLDYLKIGNNPVASFFLKASDEESMKKNIDELVRWCGTTIKWLKT